MIQENNGVLKPVPWGRSLWVGVVAQWKQRRKFPARRFAHLSRNEVSCISPVVGRMPWVQQRFVCLARLMEILPRRNLGTPVSFHCFLFGLKVFHEKQISWRDLFFYQAWCLEVPGMSTEVLDLISKGLKLMILSMVGFYCSSGGLKTSATLWPLPTQFNPI